MRAAKAATRGRQMTHEMLATVLWTMLGVSIVLAILGVALRSTWLLAIAAMLTLSFGILAIFSIGIFIIALALIEAGLAWNVFRSTNGSVER
jgi:hypothetical protein